MNNKYLFYEYDEMDESEDIMYYTSDKPIDDIFEGQPINYYCYCIHTFNMTVTRTGFNNYEKFPYFTIELETIPLDVFFKFLKRSKKFYFMKQIEKIIYNYI